MKLTATIRRGFTLIELLIVITIIGVLTALVTTNLQGARSRARDTRRKSDLRAIEQSVRLYYNDAKQFPASGTGPAFAIVGCGTVAIPAECNWGSPFATDTSTYMGALPMDPSSSDLTALTYKYVSPSDDQFILIAQLENLSDSDITDSHDRCASLYDSNKVDETKDFVICAQ